MEIGMCQKEQQFNQRAENRPWLLIGLQYYEKIMHLKGTSAGLSIIMYTWSSKMSSTLNS